MGKYQTQKEKEIVLGIRNSIHKGSERREREGTAHFRSARASKWLEHGAWELWKQEAGGASRGQ